MKKNLLTTVAFSLLLLLSYEGGRGQDNGVKGRGEGVKGRGEGVRNGFDNVATSCNEQTADRDGGGEGVKNGFDSEQASGCEGGGNCYDTGVKNEGSGNLLEGGSNLALRDGGHSKATRDGSHSLVQPREGGHGFALPREGGNSFREGSHGR